MSQATGPMNPGDNHHAQARFIKAMQPLPEDAATPLRLCRACVTGLPIERSGISVHSDEFGLEFLSASDAVAERLEWSQITLGQGPAVDAFNTGEPVVALAPGEEADRWPLFVRELDDQSPESIWALPLQLGAVRVGVLDLYRSSPIPLTGREMSDAVQVAEVVTAILLAAGRSGRLVAPLTEWWNQPLPTREVHQATGMLVVQLGVGAREAYARLQAHAFASGRPLDAVAHDVVFRRLRFEAS